MLEVGNGGMTDDEYRAHFSMWAALKSPLLMGNDLRTLSAKSLTILNNPAVIAISQDPHGSSASRIRRDFDIAGDKYGVHETHLWSGALYGGDQVVVFLNAGGEDKDMNATLAEIFLHDGPEGSAPQVKESWELYDLWANRMDDVVAQKVLSAPVGEAIQLLRDANWYNATATSYQEGLKKGDERLLGKKIGIINPGGTLSARVKSHSAEMFRLRSAGFEGKRKFRAKEDL
jgi:alpha-galactosidase